MTKAHIKRHPVVVLLTDADLKLLNGHAKTLKLTRAATLRQMIRQFSEDADTNHARLTAPRKLFSPRGRIPNIDRDKVARVLTNLLTRDGIAKGDVKHYRRLLNDPIYYRLAMRNHELRHALASSK